MYEELLSSVAGSSGGSDSRSYGNEHDLSTAIGAVQITPVGLNLGSILQPFTGGNPQTGGYDYDPLSRLGFGSEADLFADQRARLPVTSGGMSNTILLVIAGGVILFLVMKVRK